MQRSDSPPDSIARWLTRLVLCAIAFLSFSNFDTALLGMGSPQPANPMQVNEAASLQQYAIFALWLVAIGLSFMPNGLRSKPHTRGLGWLLAFYAYAALSALWCADLSESVPKAVVFVICSFGAWRMTGVISIEEFIVIARRSLWALMLVSVFALLLEPATAISHEWMHEGDWKGVFLQKQGLGVTGAYFLLLVVTRILQRFRWTDAAGVLLGLLLVFESGSRGGAIIAALAPFVILVARRSGHLSMAFSAIVNLAICTAFAVMTYLAWTGDDAIQVGDLTVDVSERTYIWSFALAHWQLRPWLGFGMNGFWTNPQTIWDFARVYRWVLNDYHSGYLAILVQTGVGGLVLFLLMVRHVCGDLRRLLHLPESNPTLVLVTGLLIMLFIIDLTETTFLRSTNFGQCMFSFLAFSLAAIAHPAPVRRMSPFAAIAG